MGIKKEKINFKTKASPFPRLLKLLLGSNLSQLKQRRVQSWKWTIELTSNLFPKPGMIEEEKGLVNKPMVLTFLS